MGQPWIYHPFRLYKKEFSKSLFSSLLCHVHGIILKIEKPGKEGERLYHANSSAKFE
jgi:hypothetical protein